MGLLLKVFVGLLLLVIVVTGGVYVLGQQQPSVAQGLQPIAATTQAARSFDDKIDAAKKAADEAKKTGKPVEVEITLSEEEITSKVAETTASAGGTAPGGLQAAGTQVHLQGGNIIATSQVTVQGISLNVGVVAQPQVVDGRTQIVIREIQTGALPIPDAVKAQINAQIGQAVDPAKLGLPFDLSQLQVVDGKIVLKGTAKP